MRRIALEVDDGDLLGSEDEIVAKLQVSKVTVRQAARLVEREGLVRVRRGIKGGYFAARPSVEMVQSVVCGYLDTLGLESSHTGNVANALWIEVMREAASAPDRESAKALAADFSDRIAHFDDHSSLQDVGKFEQVSRAAIFKLIDGTYIEVIFGINGAFARMQLRGNTGHLDEESHANFVRSWKKAKLLEFEAIAQGDPLLAMMAALQERKLWMQRAGAHDELGGTVSR